MTDKQKLIEVVKAWVQVDNQIHLVNQKLKELKIQKKKQNEQMITIMKENEIDNFDIKDGQIRYKKQISKKPLTQKTLFHILSKHPQFNEEQAKHLHQFIFDSRTTVEKDIIVRKTFESPS